MNFLCVDIEVIIPNIRNIESREVPPRLKKGSGIPTTGISPITIARLIMTLKPNVKINPPITRRQKRSRAFTAK